MDIEQLKQQLKLTVDRLGMNIDEGIFETVLYLNAHGLNTTASCEGHLDRGLAFPWVEFSSKEAESAQEKFYELSKQRDLLLKENNNNYESSEINEKSEEMWKQQADADSLNREIAENLIDLLNKFYKDKQQDIDSRLIITSIGSAFRLLSQGGIFQKGRIEDQRENFLKNYKNEMKEFTEFLKTYLK